MVNDPHAGVRPAGAPMVPMARPDGARPDETRPETLAAEAMDEARDAGRELTDRARERVMGELDRGSVAAGGKVHDAAGDVRDVAAHLHERRRETSARVADEIADRLERAGTYLADADPDRMLGDARDFARRRPGVVLAGAAVAGLVIGRLAKMTVGGEPTGTAGGAR